MYIHTHFFMVWGVPILIDLLFLDILASLRSTSAGARSCRDLSATATANSPRPAAFRTSRAIVWAWQCTGCCFTILWSSWMQEKYWKPLYNLYTSVIISPMFQVQRMVSCKFSRRSTSMGIITKRGITKKCCWIYPLTKYFHLQNIQRNWTLTVTSTLCHNDHKIDT